MEDVNLETVTDTQSWYKIWSLNGFNFIRVQRKTSQETERSLRKFLEPSGRPKVIYTDNALEFGKSSGDKSRDHRTSTHHRSEKMVSLRERYAD